MILVSSCKLLTGRQTEHRAGEREAEEEGSAEMGGDGVLLSLLFVVVAEAVAGCQVSAHFGSRGLCHGLSCGTCHLPYCLFGVN